MLEIPVFCGGSCHPALEPGGAILGHETLPSLGIDQAVHARQRGGFVLGSGLFDFRAIGLDLSAHHGPVLPVPLVALFARDQPLLATFIMGHFQTSVKDL